MRNHSKSAAKFIGGVMAAAICFLLCVASPGMADDDDFEDFAELTLEEMLNQTVTSATKVEQSIMEAPNAMSVITAEDIRRSGARNIPEALRLAPGVFVAQTSGNRWEVTIGGFANNSYTNKLLVLIDGVSIYTSTFGGVEWDYIPVTLDEIERIEVIRGPGGVLYGANATNGVINIITRGAGGKAKNYANTVVGTQNRREGNAGGTLRSEDGSAGSRLSVSYIEDEGLGKKNGSGEIDDSEESYTIASRNVFEFDDNFSISLDGRFRGGQYDFPAVNEDQGDFTAKVENSLLRYRMEQQLESGGQWYIQTYYTRKLEQQRENNAWVPGEDNRVTDIEGQALIPYEAMGEHHLIVGGGQRWVWVEKDLLRDEQQDYTVWNAYVHDEWRISEQLRLNAGVKYEDISLVDPTWQWRAALLIMPNEEHSFRLAAANAYRSPSLFEQYLNIDIGLPPALGFLVPSWPAGEPLSLVSVQGDEDIEAEEVISYEVGYRGIWFERVNVDLSYSYKEYDNYITFALIDPGFTINYVNPFPPPPIIPFGPLGQRFVYFDGGEATSHSIDAGIDARLTEELRLAMNYSHVEVDIDGDGIPEAIDRNSARNFGRVSLMYTAASGFMFDVTAYYQDEVTIPAVDFAGAEPFEIDAFWRIDSRVAQRFALPSGDLEIGFVGQNLGEEWHQEYTDWSSDPGSEPFEIRRSYYGYVEYIFD